MITARRLPFLCAIVLLVALVPVVRPPLTAAAADPVRLFVNGHELQPDVPPQLVGGRTLVPVRVVAEALGAQVTWNESARLVEIRGSKSISLQVGSAQALVDGESVGLDAPALILGGRTLVPIRFVAEALDFAVVWDNSLRAVRLTAGAGLSPEVLETYLWPAYTAHLQVQVSLDAQGFTVVSGTFDPAATGWTEVAVWQEGARPVSAPVSGNHFTVRVRLGGGTEAVLYLGGRTSGTSFASVARLRVRVPAGVDPQLAAGGGLTVADLVVTDHRLTVTPAVTPDGFLELTGSSTASWTDLLVWSADSSAQPVKTAVAVNRGKFQAVLPLPGPATYTLYVGAREDGSASYRSVAELTVTMAAASDLAPVTSLDPRIRLAAPLAAGAAYADFVPVAGEIVGHPGAEPVVLATIERTDVQADMAGTDAARPLKATQAIPVQDGRFSGSLWLRFGPGRYRLTLGLPVDRRQWQEGLEFSAVNTATTDNRYLAPSRGIESDHPQITGLAANLTAGYSSDMEKVRAIHDWVARHISYDYDKYSNATFSHLDGAVRTLQRRTGVCQDYSFLTVALLRAAGIPARLAYGTAQGYGGWGDHAWVEARAGDRWVTMDPTWDAGHLEGDQFVPGFSLRYFDPLPQLFQTDHRWQGYEY